jgi:hypothetical protein
MASSPLGADVFWSIAKGTAVQLIAKPNQPHSSALVPDVVATLAAVARRGTHAWNRAWHVPHAEDSTAVVLNHIASISGTAKARSTLMPMTGVRGVMIKLFVPPWRAVEEMSYEFDYPFIVDLREFGAEFFYLGLPSPLDVGLKATLDAYTRAPAKACTRA